MFTQIEICQTPQGLWQLRFLPTHIGARDGSYVLRAELLALYREVHGHEPGTVDGLTCTLSVVCDDRERAELLRDRLISWRSTT